MTLPSEIFQGLVDNIDILVFQFITMEVPSFHLQCPISVLTVYDHHTGASPEPCPQTKIAHVKDICQNQLTTEYCYKSPIMDNSTPYSSPSSSTLSAAVTNQLFFTLFELFNDHRQEQAARFACLQINDVAELVLLLLLLSV
jgi:hypothetical protein